MILTTSQEASGSQITRQLGIVRGTFVFESASLLQQTPTAAILSALSEEALTQATRKMEEQARKLDADAIIALRYDTQQFTPGTTVVLAYGTAVQLDRVKEDEMVLELSESSTTLANKFVTKTSDDDSLVIDLRSLTDPEGNAQGSASGDSKVELVPS